MATVPVSLDVVVAGIREVRAEELAEHAGILNADAPAHIGRMEPVGHPDPLPASGHPLGHLTSI
jgi:hypothetical protein